MYQMVLAADPLAVGGQIAAIIICIYILIFILMAVVFNLAMAFGLGWVREKVNIIKLLRPTVDSVNKVTEAAAQGVPPSKDEHAVVRTAAAIPEGVQNIDRKVEQASEHVAGALIEFRARTVQVQTVVKAFLLPGLMRREKQTSRIDGELQFKSPGYRMLMEEAKSEQAYDNGRQTVTAGQLKDAPTH